MFCFVQFVHIISEKSANAKLMLRWAKFYSQETWRFSSSPRRLYPTHTRLSVRSLSKISLRDLFWKTSYITFCLDRLKTHTHSQGGTQLGRGGGLDEIKKKQQYWPLWFKIRSATHGKCSYVCMYINAVADSIMLQLYLRHDFYNIIFQLKRIYIYIYIYSIRVNHSPLPNEKFWVRTCTYPRNLN